MANLILPHVYCPLCDEPMKEAKVKIRNSIASMFFCKPCEIGIYDFDPAFNKWKDTDKGIPCPSCGHEKVKWFARYLDGFFKAKCPECGIIFKKDGDVKFEDNNVDKGIIIPDEMDSEASEAPIDIKIPYKFLEKKMGKDKVNQLKNKRKKQQDG